LVDVVTTKLTSRGWLVFWYASLRFTLISTCLFWCCTIRYTVYLRALKSRHYGQLNLVRCTAQKRKIRKAKNKNRVAQKKRSGQQSMKAVR